MPSFLSVPNISHFHVINDINSPLAFQCLASVKLSVKLFLPSIYYLVQLVVIFHTFNPLVATAISNEKICFYFISEGSNNLSIPVIIFTRRRKVSTSELDVICMQFYRHEQLLF